MKINSKDFLVTEGKKVKLTKWSTIVKPVYKSKEQYKQLLREHIEELRLLQNLLYASNRYSMLLIFQSMDAAGKDGSIKHVMSGVNPQGCQVFSFKHPVLRNSSMIFYGVLHAVCLNEDKLGSLIDLIMRKYWLFGCIQRFFIGRDSQIIQTRKPFGQKDIILLLTWRITFIETEPELSNFSFTFQRRNSENAFSNALTNLIRTGN